MKTSILKRIICICLALFMVFSIAACGKTEQNPTKPSSSVNNGVDSKPQSTESQPVDASTSSNSGSSTNDDSGSKVQAGIQSTSSNSSPNIIKQTIEYNKPASNTGHNGKDYSNFNPYEGIEKYKGTTVKFATWINHLNTEGAEPIKSFKEKYNINVELVYCSQDNYVEELLALIAVGKAPDVFVDGAMFPFTAQIAQDFSVTGMDLNEPIWSMPYINACSANGKVYAVSTINSPWNSVSSVIYNRELMEANGIKTPTEYYEEGNWTWETMKSVMQQVKNLGADYVGGCIDSMDLVASTGASIVSYNHKDGTFKNTSNDPNVLKALQYVAGLNKEKLIITDISKFANGKVGLVVQDPYATKRTGYLRTMDGLDLDCVPLPDLDKNTKAVYAARIRGYGIVKGAKNPVAAGMFIRYYLDAENYDLDKAFLSEDLGNMFFKINDAVAKSKSATPICFNYTGIANLTGENGFAWYPSGSEPSQVATLLASQNNKVDAAINKANELLKSLK